MRIDRILKNLMTMPQSEQFDVRRSIDGIDENTIDKGNSLLFESSFYFLHGLVLKGNKVSSGFATARGRIMGKEKIPLSTLKSNFNYESNYQAKTARASSYEEDKTQNVPESYGGSRKRLNDSFSEGLDNY